VTDDFDPEDATLQASTAEADLPILQADGSDRATAEPPGGPDTGTSGGRRPTLAVVGATMLFFAMCMSFLINTPTGIGPDEPYQFDRVIAARHGQVILDPEEINVSKGARGIERVYIKTQMRRGSASWAEFQPLLRDERPSLAELGGNARSPNRDVSNYMTQHPPLYYGLMGGLTWLIPGAEDMPADILFLIVRMFNVLLLLPLPVLFWFSARQLVGGSPIATAAAFLPLVIPGLARVSATVNNDNLAIVLGAAVVALCAKVLRGDRSVRTAVLLSLLAVAGSLTKGTILFILVLIPIAYGAQALRARRWPAPKVLGILAVGALAAGAWWLRNLLLFGAVQPDAWGKQLARANGGVRQPGVPVDMDHYWQTVYVAVPSRFFGALGLHEPPQLPIAMIWVLSILVVVCFPIAIAILAGRRWDLVILFAVPAAALVMICYQAYLHFQTYLAIPGLQGRYVYPAVFGLVFPIAVVAGLVLGRWRRWAPMLIAAGGLVVSGWAVYTSVEYTWLHRGEQLQPSNWARAFRTLAGFFPLPGAAAATLAVLVAGLVVAGTVLTAVACGRDSSGRALQDPPVELARPPVYA